MNCATTGKYVTDKAAPTKRVLDWFMQLEKCSFMSKLKITLITRGAKKLDKPKAQIFLFDFSKISVLLFTRKITYAVPNLEITLKSNISFSGKNVFMNVSLRPRTDGPKIMPAYERK